MELVFFSIITLVALERILELLKSRKHYKKLLAQGGLEYGASHYQWMVLLHATWFGAMFFEVLYFQRPFYLSLFIVALIGMLIGNALRYQSMHALGERWCTRIVVLANKPLVRNGLYRYFKHPIYVGVVLEIASIPLLHTAYLTAGIYTVLNLILLRVRIKAEEKALGLCLT